MTSAPIGALQVKLYALLGNYERQTDVRIDGQTGSREVSLQTKITTLMLTSALIGDGCLRKV